MSNIHFDFEAALVIATLVTGVLWALDKFILAPRRAAAGQEGDDAGAPWIIEFSRSFFPVILAVLLLRSFVVEPFRIPSSSMVPTLLEGDFILVDKFAYGLRLPVLHTKFLSLGEPQRGDVAVFRYPPDPGKDYIKRIVGLPGDTIEYHDRKLSINGRRIPLQSLGIYAGDNAPVFETARAFREKLGAHDHRILLIPDRRSLSAGVQVPPGHYFVMGDNRDNSSDSRVWGFVPDNNLVGKAFLIWMSVDMDDWLLRGSRIGSIID